MYWKVISKKYGRGILEVCGIKTDINNSQYMWQGEFALHQLLVQNKHENQVCFGAVDQRNTSYMFIENFNFFWNCKPEFTQIQWDELTFHTAKKATRLQLLSSTYIYIYLQQLYIKNLPTQPECEPTKMGKLLLGQNVWC